MQTAMYRTGPVQPAIASQAGLALRSCLERAESKSMALVAFLEAGMDRLLGAWIALACLAGMFKVAFAPLAPHGFADIAAMMLPYMLVALAPVAGYRLATGSFPGGQIVAQPSIRLARLGSWRKLDIVEARRNPLFGPAGYMTSLLVGMLLNVPVRTFEFLASVPAIRPDAPQWGLVIFHAMAVDLVVMSFFYMVCFVMALRSIPLFPRMLAYAWVIDIGLQLAIARQVAAAPNLPVEVAEPLAALLYGNIQKVLISAFVWLPYLLLSERVNVTFRQRTASR